MTTITLQPVADVAALGEIWRALEQRADLSFFQSWTWTGCLAARRFPDPVLLRATSGGADVALALFNRRRGRLLLGETGEADRDAVFIEHNGILAAREAGADLRARCLRPIDGRRLVLSGVDDEHLGLLRDLPGTALVRRTREAPYIDYAALPAGPFAASLSPNTRYQIGRSDRRYAARGPLRIQRAASVAEARAFLTALAALHQRHWERRGSPGAFANPAFTRFHHALIARAMPARETDLLRIEAGEAVIGYLYNFIHRGRVHAYQSGFDYDAAQPHEKPGLTCHHLAIELYRREGMARYDFLAGEDRYKTSLANASATLHWLEYLPQFSPAWFAAAGRRVLGR